MGKHDRYTKRYIRRVETEFFDGKRNYRGISSDFSVDGLFIRTKRGLAPESVLELTLYLPDGKKSKLKGIVRRTIKTGSSLSKNGMGVQLIERDKNFDDFIKSFSGEILLIKCPNCGTKNKLPADKLSLGPKCGTCKEPLPTN